MNTTTKYVLWGVGGVAILTALGFSVASLFKGKNNDKTYTQQELDDLLRKEREEGLNKKEKERKENLENQVTPLDPGETTNEPGNVAFPIGNNDKGKHIAQIQTAINQKFNNNTAEYKGSTWSTWCCTGGDKKLAVDGQMGPNTMKAIKKYYGMCCECECTVYTACINRVCNCTSCNVTKSDYNRIISGATTTDAKLKSEGYGFEYFSGFTNGIDKYEHDFGRSGRRTSGCNPTCPKYETCVDGVCVDMGAGRTRTTDPNSPDWKDRRSNFSNFTLSNKEQLQGEGQLEWRDMEGVLGDFYKTKNAFVDDDIDEPSNLTHSYGMGKGFGFSGGVYSDWDASCSDEMCRKQSLMDFYNELP